jgi:hypothetical protein
VRRQKKPGFTVLAKLKGVNHKLPFLRVGAMNPACTPALCELTKVLGARHSLSSLSLFGSLLTRMITFFFSFNL